ncbi:hypothetical protein [Rathayibacter tanaceti]|uniref:hypothetical protein n=1 Tax=Rathayibacter tanaceti TaxID=1671680 RepID=UPI001372AF4F|nr:hypothetical protein [Rathayibacter tanaceti]
MPSETPSAPWRARVAELSGSLEGEAAPVLTPIGLQFELRRLVRRADDPWRAPASERISAKGYDPDERREYRLATRPVVRGRGGAWNRSTLTWKSLNFQTHRLALDPEHQRWFAEFAALHRATRTVHLGQDPDWIHLDDYESPLLWQLLEHAHAAAIPLLAPEKGTVRLAGDARLAMTVSEEEGALHLRPVLRIDGAEHPLESARPIARHGIYAVTSDDPSSLVLAPAPLPFGDEELRLLDHPGSTVVPAHDVVEFVREHLPRCEAGWRCATKGWRPRSTSPSRPDWCAPSRSSPGGTCGSTGTGGDPPIAPARSTAPPTRPTSAPSCSGRALCSPRPGPRSSRSRGRAPSCGEPRPRCSWSSSCRCSRVSAECGWSARAWLPTTAS